MACFGKNNKTNLSLNIPGLFPIVFEGNCIYHTAPLTQCSDDGAGDTPLIMETDISSAFARDISGKNTNLDGNSYINADACEFFEGHDTYPDNLGALASTYISRSDETSLDALHLAISKNPDIGSDAYGDSSLHISTPSPDSRYSALYGTKNIDYTNSSTGQGIINIALDTSELKFASFGKILDIKLKSISGFPSFLMDWYHRQLDEIVSSLGHLPDIKIFLPDLSRLTDTGWMNTF